MKTNLNWVRWQCYLLHHLAFLLISYQWNFFLDDETTTLQWDPTGSGPDLATGRGFYKTVWMNSKTIGMILIKWSEPNWISLALWPCSWINVTVYLHISLLNTHDIIFLSIANSLRLVCCSSVCLFHCFGYKNPDTRDTDRVSPRLRLCVKALLLHRSHKQYKDSFSLSVPSFSHLSPTTLNSFSMFSK